MNVSYFRRLLHKNAFVYGLLATVCLLAYGNILGNQFTVVDDIGTFVNNETVHSFSAAAKTLQLQLMIYSIFYQLFGPNPLPVHIMAISLHMANTILLFTITKSLFNRNTGIISAILFAVHPINTEAITWISGCPYLFNALFIQLIILNYLWFKKTNEKRYLIQSVCLFVFILIFLKNVWLVTIPLILLLIEQFILEKRINLKASKHLFIFLIPLAIYAISYLPSSSAARLSSREVSKPLNQQMLKPIIESGPYTVFTMLKLFVYPKDLMIYYDGNPVSPTYYASMYVVTLLYVGLFFFLWKKNRALAGILLIAVVLQAPTFSPIKVAWFLSERYLYYSNGFLCTFLAYWLAKIVQKKYMFALVLVFCLTLTFLIRTIFRNMDYRTSKTLALATIKTSPLGIRGYDDLGGYYLMNNDPKTAINYYYKTLTLMSDSNTAVSNLGYIYILYGFPEHPKRTETRTANELYDLGKSYLVQEQYTNSFYYFYQSTLADPNKYEAYESMVTIYLKSNQFKHAENLILELLKKYPDHYKLYSKLSYAAFQQHQYEKAEVYMREFLEKDPMNKNAQDNLHLIQSAKAASVQ